MGLGNSASGHGSEAGADSERLVEVTLRHPLSLHRSLSLMLSLFNRCRSVIFSLSFFPPVEEFALFVVNTGYRRVSGIEVGPG